MKKNSKQRLFEVMQKVDKTFKPKINENLNSIPSEYQIEFDNLKKEYGDNVVNSFFTNGLPGFYDSRTRGNYSLDAIKQNLNHLKLNEEPANDVMNEAQAINPKYTHFAVTKQGKIVNGWDYKGIDSTELKTFKKDYFFNDIIEMGIDPKSVGINTLKSLQQKGINPFDTNNWYSR